MVVPANPFTNWDKLAHDVEGYNYYSDPSGTDILTLRDDLLSFYNADATEPLCELLAVRICNDFDIYPTL